MIKLVTIGLAYLSHTLAWLGVWRGSSFSLLVLRTAGVNPAARFSFFILKKMK
jgi:hypothetical protein